MQSLPLRIEKRMMSKRGESFSSESSDDYKIKSHIKQSKVQVRKESSDSSMEFSRSRSRSNSRNRRRSRSNDSHAKSVKLNMEKEAKKS